MADKEEAKRLEEFATKVVQRDKMLDVIKALHAASRSNKAHVVSDSDRALLWWCLTKMKENRRKNMVGMLERPVAYGRLS